MASSTSNMLTAENLLLNGGKSSLSTTSMGVQGLQVIPLEFLLTSDFSHKLHVTATVRHRLATLTLPTVNGNDTASGTPLKFHCSGHSLASSSPNFWLLVDDARSVRCFIPT